MHFALVTVKTTSTAILYIIHNHIPGRAGIDIVVATSILFTLGKSW